MLYCTLRELSDESPFVYFIYRIDNLDAVAWFVSETTCSAAYEYYDSKLFDWVAVNYHTLFNNFALFNLDMLKETGDVCDIE